MGAFGLGSLDSYNPLRASDPFADTETDAAAIAGVAQTSGISTARPIVIDNGIGFPPPTIISPGTRPSILSEINSIIASGVGVWKNNQQVQLLQSQINKGQQPSIVAGPGGTPSAPFSISKSANGAISETFGSAVGGTLGTISPTIIIFVVLALVAVMLLGRR